MGTGQRSKGEEGHFVIRASATLTPNTQLLPCTAWGPASRGREGRNLSGLLSTRFTVADLQPEVITLFLVGIRSRQSAQISQRTNRIPGLQNNHFCGRQQLRVGVHHGRQKPCCVSMTLPNCISLLQEHRGGHVWHPMRERRSNKAAAMEKVAKSRTRKRATKKAPATLCVAIGDTRVSLWPWKSDAIANFTGVAMLNARHVKRI